MKVGWYCVGHFCQQIGFVGTIWSWTFTWLAPVFLEAIATSPSFSPLHISAIAKGFILLGILFCWCTICCSFLHSLRGMFITQSFDVSSGERRGDFGERKKTVVRCVLFSLPSRHFLQCETSKGYCNFVVVIIPLNLGLISLVFHTELNGFSLFLDGKIHW